jgi:hypothetical protein
MTLINPLKRSSISSVATLENLHINTYTTTYTSIKRVHTTLEFFLCKKRKGIPLKMLMTPFPFASRNESTSAGWRRRTPASVGPRGRGRRSERENGKKKIGEGEGECKRKRRKNKMGEGE